MAPLHATWQSINESRCAVLDCFFWQSRTGKTTLQDAKGFLSPDPRLDHDPVRVCVACDTIGPMPPLEALRAPERLKMLPGGMEGKEKRLAESGYSVTSKHVGSRGSRRGQVCGIRKDQAGSA
jgi:hypothetical protein